MSFTQLSAGRVLLYAGDCQVALDLLPGNSVDACVTDPPYGLQFMGKAWDHGVPSIEVWQRVLRVLKPGAHLLAMGGTRTYHRLACAIEDAGFEIRDCIMWIYGSGFPKSHNIGDGRGTALKPACEPIVVARKPLSESTVAANVLKWGTGALNIDGCRVEYTGDTDPRTFGGAWRTDKAAKNVYEGGYAGTNQTVSPKGRWPANVIHDGSEEVLECLPMAPGQLLDVAVDAPSAKTGNVYGKMNRHGEKSAQQRYTDNGGTNFAALPGQRRNDSGSAARFFYCAKANKKERNGSKHPTVKPLKLMEYLTRLVTPPNGIILDPFAGTGTTAQAAVAQGFRAVLAESDLQSQADIRKRLDTSSTP